VFGALIFTEYNDEKGVFMIFKDKVVLSNGVEVPTLGFGTWQIKDGEEAYESTLKALKLGYRHIDTAAAYRNEASVGKAIKDSGIPRKEIFITTKLQSHLKDYDQTFIEFELSRERLGVDYIDLYLIHAPWPWSEWSTNPDYSQGNIAAWKAMEKLYQQKKVRAIGVSNFEIDHLNKLLKETTIVPHANQIPLWIGRPQIELRAFCKERGIAIEAYSPLATGRIFKLDLLNTLAKKYQRTPAQVAIRFTVQLGAITLPKSVNPIRIEENGQLDFTISDEDMVALLNVIPSDYRE
jgi:diketogulonate reductase-like aldo/keto reductase